MINIKIQHNEPVVITSEGKYSQNLHIWQDKDGILNFKIINDLREKNEMSI